MAAPLKPLHIAGYGAPPAAHGFLHTLAHLAGQTVNDFETAAIKSVPGLYHLTGGLIHDPINTLKTVGESTLQDIEHPLRHPGFTALDILGLAGGAGALAGRAAEAGRVAAGTSRFAVPAVEGSQAPSFGAAMGRAILHGTPPERRILRGASAEPGKPLEVKYGSYSKNPLIKAGQKQLDLLHETYPDKSFGPLFKTQAARLKKASFADNITINKGLRDLPARLVAKYKGLTHEEFVAARVVAEGVPVEDRIAFHENQLHTGELRPRQVAETNRQIKLLGKAATFLTERPFVDETGNTHMLPAVKPEHAKLNSFVEDARQLANARDAALLSNKLLWNPADPHDKQLLESGAPIEGRLSASAIRRRLAPLNVITGRGLQTDVTTLRKQINSLSALKRPGAPDPPKLTELKNKLKEYEGQLTIKEHTDGEPEIHGPLMSEGLANELFRVPYVLDRSPRSLVGGMKQYKGGKTEPPSTVTHAFHAAILKGGTGRVDLAHVVAESYIEAQRFLYFKELRSRLIASAVDDPNLIPEQYRQPIVADWSRLPRELKFASDLLKSDKPLSWEEAEAGGRWYDKLREFVFPDKTVAGAGTPGVKWIDTRLLGGLDKQNPLLSAFDYPAFSKVIRFADRANEAQKAALLYLKPAYLFPNMLGNIALNIVQQGFLAPVNIFKATVLAKRLDPEVRASIRTAMGGGLSRILESRPDLLGKVTSLGNKLAEDVYGPIIDDPFRLSAFLHEARIEGFIKPQELKALTQDPKYADKFAQISERANDEIINYERLGPAEQAILRRLVFFYPWVKGSSRYAVQLTTNHPVTAGIVGQAGKQGEQWQQNVLGDVPSFAEGLIPGGAVRNGMAPVLNPSSFSILETPATLAEQLQGLVTSNPNPDLSPISNLAPIDQALLSALTFGKASQNPHAATQPVLKTAAQDFYGGIPLATLIKGLTQTKPPNSLYPDTGSIGWLTPTLQKVSRFAGAGGLTPRPYNVSKGQFISYLQKHPHP